ncbi:MAG: SAM-dependent methyltransferase [Gammaproteobacteria bacterium]|nr:SAM-dependent methyltransferase [Gammaproteobacteria bacterium]
MSSRTLNLDESVYAYLLSNIHPETPVLRELRETTRETLSMYAMQISPEQGAFMALLCRVLNARLALEVGTFTGYSALAVTQVLPKDGKLITCDVSKEWTDIGRKYWTKAGVADKIDLRLAPATDTLSHLLEERGVDTFDFAFIDADKGNYDAYYELCLQLIRVGGLIAIDNVLWGGRTSDPTVTDNATVALRNLNSKVRQDDRVFATMLPVGDGLTLVLKL